MYNSVGIKLTVYLERHYTQDVSLKSRHSVDISLFILLSPTCLQRRSRRSPPAVRWRSNRKCRQTPKTQESSILEPSSTDPRVCTTCLLWLRRWHMAPTYTLRVKRKKGKRRSFRQWWGWEAAEPNKNKKTFLVLLFIINVEIVVFFVVPENNLFMFSVCLCLLGLSYSLWVPAAERCWCEPEGHERQRSAAPCHLSGTHRVRNTGRGEQIIKRSVSVQLLVIRVHQHVKQISSLKPYLQVRSKKLKIKRLMNDAVT